MSTSFDAKMLTACWNVGLSARSRGCALASPIAFNRSVIFCKRSDDGSEAAGGGGAGVGGAAAGGGASAGEDADEDAVRRAHTNATKYTPTIKTMRPNVSMSRLPIRVEQLF